LKNNENLGFFLVNSKDPFPSIYKERIG